VMLIRRIRELLYGQGFTISGARNLLENQNQVNGRTSGLPLAALNVAALRHEIKEIINLLSA
jgi:DNA-binding transcriptional MerR regulator